MRIFNFLTVAALAATFTFTSCDNAGNDNNEGVVETARERDEDTHEDGLEAKENAMDKVFAQYKDLRDELYDGDAEGAKEQAREMKQAIANAKTDEMTPEQVQNWNNWAGKLTDPLNKIEGAATIDAQRTAFSTLTPDVHQGVKTFGVGKDVYYYHCPMAMDNKGAYWLSTDKEVRNPYYGEAMKTCGTSKETLTARRN